MLNRDFNIPFPILQFFLYIYTHDNNEIIFTFFKNTRFITIKNILLPIEKKKNV